MVEDSKSLLRKQIAALMANQKQEERVKKSAIISNKLLATKEFKEAKSVLLYASISSEVDTYPMIQESLKLDKKVALPVIQKENKGIVPVLIQAVEELEQGPFGIPQPKTTSAVLTDRLDLVIVPGLAFDRQNNRLGRGAGYYDRFLKTLPPGTPTFGLAFDFQIMDRLPCDSHDVPMTAVISNE